MAGEQDFTPEEMAVLRPLFLSSGREYIAIFAKKLGAIGQGDNSAATFEALHRSIHSLKGAALQLGAVHIGGLALAMEQVAKVARETVQAIPPEGIQLLEDGIEQLFVLMKGLEEDEACSVPPPGLLSQLEAMADSLHGHVSRGKAGQE